MIIQTSCSELLVDTNIHDPEQAYKVFSDLMRVCNWESSPPLSLQLLSAMKTCSEARYPIEADLDISEVMIYDKDGNRAWLRYGDNGYMSSLGYYFDSHCNHGDWTCYPIFQQAIKHLNGELYSCDGGSTNDYYDWLRRDYPPADWR